jgi:hypothetical protein
MSNSCKHGQLARSCELCHNEEDILKLKRINNDLLNSLKVLLDWYNCKITPPEEYFDSVRAAIAKAEGSE